MCIDIGYIRFEVFAATPMKNDVFWDVAPCGSCEHLRFGGTYRLHHQSDKNRRTRSNVSPLRRLLVNANVVPSSPILATMMMVELPSSETSVLT
jgi:hypothetical protein